MASLNRIRSVSSLQRAKDRSAYLEVDMFPEMIQDTDLWSGPKPCVTWVGGKQSIADRLTSFFPKDYGTYFEPFLGGGSVFFSLQRQHAVISDENRWLIDTYLALKNDWKLVASCLDKMMNSRKEYLKVRAIDPWALGLYERAAQFIYLNKTCFRGLFRVNRKGQFNFPYGLYDRRYYDGGNLEAVSLALSKVEIRSGDYELCRRTRLK